MEHLTESPKAKLKKEPWEMTRKEWRENVEKESLIHGTNIEKGEEFDYVEPGIGEFTKTMYAGAGEGTFEELGGIKLAYFKSIDQIKKIEHYATGVGVFPKKGEPYILLTEKPEDAKLVKEDGLYDLYYPYDLISHSIPLGAEIGDIISEIGAEVLYRIPLKRYKELKAKDTHDYFVKQALSEGKPVPDKVLCDYPDIPKPEIVSGLKIIDSISDPMTLRELAQSGELKDGLYEGGDEYIYKVSGRDVTILPEYKASFNPKTNEFDIIKRPILSYNIKKRTIYHGTSEPSLNYSNLDLERSGQNFPSIGNEFRGIYFTTKEGEGGARDWGDYIVEAKISDNAKVISYAEAVGKSTDELLSDGVDVVLNYSKGYDYDEIIVLNPKILEKPTELAPKANDKEHLT